MSATITQRQYAPLPNLMDYKSVSEIVALRHLSVEENCAQVRYWLRRQQKIRVARAGAVQVQIEDSLLHRAL